jgi:hypothetical protein
MFALCLGAVTVLRPSRGSCELDEIRNRCSNVCDSGHALLTSPRTHARTSHKLDYCGRCCDFYDLRSRYCPNCHLFCMSPTCFPAVSKVTTGTALDQRHERTPYCPPVRGRATGVSEEDTLDYLRRLCEKLAVLLPSILDANTVSRL